LPKALEDCKQAVDEDGESSAYHDSLGWTHLRMDDPARAIKSFDRAIALKAGSRRDRRHTPPTVVHCEIRQSDRLVGRRRQFADALPVA
jgi:hypothetical protein